MVELVAGWRASTG